MILAAAHYDACSLEHLLLPGKKDSRFFVQFACLLRNYKNNTYNICKLPTKAY